MLDLLIRTLKKMQSNLVFEEVADIFWLAAHMGEATFDISEPLQKDEMSHSRLSTPTVPPPRSATQTTDDTVQADITDIRDGTRKNLYNQTATRSRGASSGSISVRVAGMSALTGERAIGHALRPLMRRVAARNQFVLNEEATVRSIADARILMPVLQAAQARWLDVALVIEESPSMVIWRQTIADFARLLEEQGAFRSLQTWYFATYSDEQTLCLYPNRTALANQSGRRSPSELSHPRKQRLILVLSDCIAPAWYDTRGAAFINSWAKSNPVALVQMLPQRLWTRTGLRSATKLYLRARTPGLVNRYLEKQWLLDRRPKDNNHSMAPLPVVSLEPESLATWAQLLVGGGKRLAWGVVFSNFSRTIETEEVDKDNALNLTPRQLVQNFQAIASPLAQRLAGYLSAVPLSLPVMHLVQRHMLPESTQSHLAEVLLSALIWQRTPYTPSLQPHELRLEFVEGVREVLRTIVPRSKQFDVLHSLSTFVDKKTGKKVFDFAALLADSDADGIFQLDADSEPFATMAIDVLDHLGSRYRQLAERFRRVVDNWERQLEPLELQEEKTVSASNEPAYSPDVHIFGHKSYYDTPVEQRLSRQADGDEIIAILTETIQLAADENRRSRTRRLLMVQGEAGIGKTCVLDCLQARIAREQPAWLLLDTYQAEAFVAPQANSFYRFLLVLKQCDNKLGIACLPDLPAPATATVELLAEWTGLLEDRLTRLRAQPLLIFFDELEWWVGLLPDQQVTLAHFFRIVWSMLLRQAQLPIMIVCAGRRSPPLKHPLLRLVSHTFLLKGFPAADLEKLVFFSHRAELLPLIKRYTEDNPWATQLLNEIFAENVDAFYLPTLPDALLRKIFAAIVGDRLDQDPDLKEVLYRLAQQRQAGFTANDALLPQGDSTLIKLMNTSFIEYNSATKRYFVVPVLARWFKE